MEGPNTPAPTMRFDSDTLDMATALFGLSVGRSGIPHGVGSELLALLVFD